jgi:hypothetical protein
VLAPWTSPETITAWLDATTWWARPQVFVPRPEMLVELLEAVAGRYLGKELVLDVRGRRVTLVLGEIRIEAADARTLMDPFTWWADLPGSREMLRWTRRLPGIGGGDPEPPPVLDKVHIESSAVAIDEHPVGDVAATVDTVRLDYGRATELVTGPVELDVHTDRGTVVAWVSRSLPDWQVRLLTDDLLTVRHRDWKFTVVARPRLVSDRQVQIDAVGVLLFGRRLMLPRFLVRQRTYDLPAGSDELELIDATLAGDDVHVRFRHPGIRQPVRPDHLRAAVREGVAQLGASVFS